MNGNGYNLVFDLLNKAHEKYPELRVCQIMSIAAYQAGWGNDDLFYCPDDMIADGLKQFLDEAK